MRGYSKNAALAMEGMQIAATMFKNLANTL